jgi:putative protein-disulfide isomerase
VGAVHVTYYTDPACPWSWAAEPGLRRLQAEFGDSLEITYVMGGLAREFRKPVETMRHVLDAAEASGMPVDPRVWLDAPPRSRIPPAWRSRQPPSSASTARTCASCARG